MSGNWIQKIVGVLMVSFLVLISGCSQKLSGRNGQDGMVVDKPDRTMEWQTKDGRRVKVTVKVPADFTGGINEYRAGVDFFEPEDIFPLFGASEQYIKKQGENRYWYGNILFEFSKEPSGGLSVATFGGRCYYGYCPDYRSQCSFIQNFGEGKDLGFADREYVKKQVLERLGQIGIDNAVILQIYALPVEYHQYCEARCAEKGLLEKSSLLKDGWNTLGDCYEVVLTVEFDRILFYEGDCLGQENKMGNGSEIRVIYSGNGIERLYVPNRYKITRKEWKTARILREEEIIGILECKLPGRVLARDDMSMELELCYLPQQITQKDVDFRIRPVWRLRLNKKDGTYEDYIFRAEDGEEIIINR